jgi:muramoyltetrapeptide carboxypeptidase
VARNNKSAQIARIKPPSLRPGDTVGIVAPASNILRDALDAGCRSLERLGYKPFFFDSILHHDLYFAGNIKRRLKELHAMFEHPEVRAVVCARGGYGCNYLLPNLDLSLIRRNPKIFAGYSDITSLLTYIHDSTGLITFHAPMVAKDFAHDGGVDEHSFKAALEGWSEWELGSGSGMRGLADGEAEGLLYGGCLSMLAASLGTPYEIHTAGTLLFVEDVAAKPYQIDRMLMQLKLAGKFDEVTGIIFGEMVDCLQHAEQPYRLEEVVMRVIGDLGVPVAYGLRSGHVSSRSVTLPIGVRATLRVAAAEATLAICEPAVIPARKPTVVRV